MDKPFKYFFDLSFLSRGVNFERLTFKNEFVSYDIFLYLKYIKQRFTIEFLQLI